VDYETFANCNNLKFVYMPATVLGTLEAKTNNYKSIFGLSSKVVYFITGTEDPGTGAGRNAYRGESEGNPG
jgi:hypothetical protein